jgi:hypothetical protein
MFAIPLSFTAPERAGNIICDPFFSSDRRSAARAASSTRLDGWRLLPSWPGGHIGAGIGVIDSPDFKQNVESSSPRDRLPGRGRPPEFSAEAALCLLGRA